MGNQSSNAFVVSYPAGGSIDKVKLVEKIQELTNVKTLEEISNLINLENLENVEKIKNIEKVGTQEELNIVHKVEEIGGVKGFATKTQPLNVMEMYDIPAQAKTFSFVFSLPTQEVEILGINVTCSGYGENDNYDLYLNDQQWFSHWYMGEVKEGLFLGTSTYVYSAPQNSVIKIDFHNDSGTEKKLWLGIRMLTDPVVDTTKDNSPTDKTEQNDNSGN